MKYVKGLFCLILSVALMLPCFYISGEEKDNEEATVSDSVLAKNSSFTLLLDNQTKSVYLTGSNGENKWNSIVTNEIYDLSTCSELFVQYMQSMVVAHYALHTDTNGTVIDAYSGAPSTETEVKKVKDGADFYYRFPQPQISFALEVRLTEDGVTLNVPFKSVEEKGDYSLLSLEIAPFFGAAASGDNGFIFYPENTGAITYFENVPFKSKSSTELNLDIYGNSNLETVMDKTAAGVATMPVYGISRGKTAVFAVATSGECDAKINVRPAVSTSSMRIHTAGFSFTYHYQYMVYLSNIVRNGKNSSGNINGSKVDKKMVSGDRTVRFFLLSGTDCDYSAMANCYRNYLTDTKQLKTSYTKGYNEIALTLLCGVKTSGELFGNNFVEMTTYGEALSIVKDYRDAGIDNLYLNLKGWSRSGYLSYPQNYSPVFALGGRKSFKRLSEYVKENNIDSTLQCGIIYTSAGWLGVRGNAAEKGTGIPVADDEEKVYLLTPKSAVKKFKQSLFDKYSFSPAFDDIGGIVYGTFNSGERTSRSETVEYWEKLLSGNKYAAVQGSNAYVFKYSDRLYDIETNGSKRLICDENIPFLSMVLYGSVALNTTPGNCAGDFEEQKLRWLEYGCSPSFELSQRSPKLLRDTDYNTLFFSKNDSIRQRVIDTYMDFSKNLSMLSETHMIKHERITEKLVQITFENGYKLLINYGDEESVYNNQTVGKKSYNVYR